MDSALNCLNATTLITALLSLIFLYFFLYRPSKPTHHPKQPPSAAGAWPILGHLHLLRNSQTPHRTLGAMADNHGPIFTIKIGTATTLVLSNWQMAKECFTTNDTAVSSRPTLISTEHMSYNKAMFGSAPYGPYWRRLRKIATLEILHNRRVEQLRHVRVSEVQTSIKELYDVWSAATKNDVSGGGYAMVEVKQWFYQVTFNMILRMAVGKRYFGGAGVVEEGEVRRCVEALTEFMRLLAVFTVADAVPCLRWFDFGGHEKEMKEIAKEWDRILSGWLEEHQNKRTLGGKDALDGGGDQDFMDVMISVLGDTKIEGIDANTTIKGTILTLFVGGIDTSSITLSWAIYLLLRNPIILEKVKQELNHQIGKDRCVSESDISKLEYLQAIVKETLRLYPPAPLSGPREVTDNCTLGGYHVKKGTRLITNLWKIHTDPSVWPDPLEFRPERFLTTHKDVDVRGCHFELLPFGGGRRICPGISFALQIVHFSLASFLHSFEILNPSNKPVDLTESYGLTNIKTAPLEILVKPCLPPNCYGTK